MPGSDIHILSTRPLGDALLKQAAGRGITIDTISFIRTEPIMDEALIRGIQSLITRPLTVVFTSMNAVQAVAGHMQAPEPSGTASIRHPSWKIFCIGAATRQLVQEHFGETAIAGTAPSAADLADVILLHPPAEVFFFCGDQRRDELPDKLSAEGVKVNELVVYRTIQTPHVIAGTYDGIAFFSPSAVHSFFSMNTLPAATRVFAIGSTTASEIQAYCPNPVIISGSPEKEALVRQMIDYFQPNI